jgi:hypothetical protein
MAERSEEEVVSGLLRISVGGIVRTVPTLKAKWVPDWLRMLVPAVAGKGLTEWTQGDVQSLASSAIPHMLDLIDAYDRTAALGGRAWLEENADPAELHAALVAMVGNASPLADDPAAMLGMALVMSGVPSAPPSSTNGSSPNGASPRKRSVRSSTPSR